MKKSEGFLFHSKAADCWMNLVSKTDNDEWIEEEETKKKSVENRFSVFTQTHKWNTSIQWKMERLN